jgi:hypothetical protein
MHGRLKLAYISRSACDIAYSEHDMAGFSESVKRQVFARQHGRCAFCGEGLNDLIENSEMNSMHFHHVRPYQAEGGDEEDNCVALCSTSYRGARDGCHYHVHEEGRYGKGGVANAMEFDFSHGHDSAKHDNWLVRWNKQYSHASKV